MKKIPNPAKNAPMYNKPIYSTSYWSSFFNKRANEKQFAKDTAYDIPFLNCLEFIDADREELDFHQDLRG